MFFTPFPTFYIFLYDCAPYSHYTVGSAGCKADSGKLPLLSAAIAAVKTIDTVKIVADNGMIISTPERKTLWNAQTPQIFEYKKILELHKKYKDFNFTDDSCLFEKEGLPVAIVEGDYSNYKITTVSDVKM